MPVATLSPPAENDVCIQVGSDESHFNVSLIVRDKVTSLSTDHNVLKRKESRSAGIRTEVPLLTSLTPYR